MEGKTQSNMLLIHHSHIIIKIVPFIFAARTSFPLPNCKYIEHHSTVENVVQNIFWPDPTYIEHTKHTRDITVN